MSDEQPRGGERVYTITFKWTLSDLLRIATRLLGSEQGYYFVREMLDTFGIAPREDDEERSSE